MDSRRDREHSSLPLAGITVVACEQAIAAPFATRQLADMGARVIKVERVGTGDFARSYDETVLGESSHFVWTNRSKESITVDLKKERGVEILRRLLKTADVFIQNLSPGAVERLGFGRRELEALNPKLITCNITGYGQDGPYRSAKAYDLLVQAESGVVAVTGTDDTPSKAGIPVADIAAGMYAFSSILGSLYDRERTGRANNIDVSLFDSLIEWMGYPLYFTKYGGQAPQRAGTSHPAIAPYGIFTSRDGFDVVLSVQNEREWVKFCAYVLHDEEISGDPRFRTAANRIKNRRDLDRLCNQSISQQSFGELEENLEAANIAFARQRTVSEVLDHPQLNDRTRWRTVETPGGEIQSLLPPLTFGGRTPRMDPVPKLGEHTSMILGSLGFTDEDIDQLRAAGVV